MKTARYSLILVATALAVVPLTNGCGNKPAAAADKSAPALVVRAQAAAERTFERRLTVQGSLAAKNYANVASRVEGNLEELWVDEGDAVVAGQTVLFQVDAANRQNSLNIAEQNLAVAEASLAVAKASAQKTEAEAHKATLDFDRYDRLHQDGRVSDNEFEGAQVQHEAAKAAIAVANAQVDLAQSQVRQADAAVAIARKNLEDAKVVAPISGFVSSRTAEPGEQMSVGKVILRIDDLSDLEAAAYLPAQYYPEVVPNKTEFRLDIAGHESGQHAVTYRSPTINTVLRTFEIKGKIENPGDRAVPGSMADLTLVFETRQGLGVPSASILVRNGKSTVFVVQEGKAVAREVTGGLQNDGWTEILSGLNAGESVVTEGQTQLRNDMPVEVL